MARDQDNTVLLEGARIIFRNFEGKEGQYNQAGARNFGVIIPDPETAKAMLADGWNIKYLKPREGDEDEGAVDEIEEETPWLSVKVGFGKGAPPKIVVITSRGKTVLDQGTVDMLDWADIKNVDLIVRPYHYDVQGRQGISAYLKSMYVTIEEDELEQKYAELDSQ